MKRPCVLVTRPAPVAGTLVQALEQAGYGVFHEPLLTIVPTDAPRPLIPDNAVLMFTSQIAPLMLRARGGEICILGYLHYYYYNNYTYHIFYYGLAFPHKVVVVKHKSSENNVATFILCQLCLNPI